MEDTKDKINKKLFNLLAFDSVDIRANQYTPTHTHTRFLSLNLDDCRLSLDFNFHSFARLKWFDATLEHCVFTRKAITRVILVSQTHLKWETDKVQHFSIKVSSNENISTPRRIDHHKSLRELWIVRNAHESCRALLWFLSNRFTFE